MAVRDRDGQDVGYINMTAECLEYVGSGVADDCSDLVKQCHTNVGLFYPIVLLIPVWQTRITDMVSSSKTKLTD